MEAIQLERALIKSCIAQNDRDLRTILFETLHGSSPYSSVDEVPWSLILDVACESLSLTEPLEFLPTTYRLCFFDPSSMSVPEEIFYISSSLHPFMLESLIWYLQITYFSIDPLTFLPNKEIADLLCSFYGCRSTAETQSGTGTYYVNTLLSWNHYCQVPFPEALKSFFHREGLHEKLVQIAESSGLISATNPATHSRY